MSSFEGVELAIWDLDGTIIDSYGIYSQVIKEAAELAQLKVPDEQTIHNNFHGSLEDSIKGALNLVDGDHLTKLLEDFLKIQEDYYSDPEEHVYNDVLGLAERLDGQGISQVVVTNRDHKGRGTASPRYLIENSSMKPYISDFVCGEDAPVRKPDARVIAGLAIAQGLAGSEILVIGDQFVDGKLAQNLGARAILVNRNPRPIPYLDQLGDISGSIQVIASLDEVQ